MIAAIMQPYFFPYIGYFQLMKAVDLFVFYDDAQYMKGGWVNRNRILKSAGTPGWLTLPVSRASITLPINQRFYHSEGTAIEEVLRQLVAGYSRSSHFNYVMPELEEIMRFGNLNIASFNANLLTRIARQLSITCKFVNSSVINKSKNLKGEARIIDLCQHIGANQYINPIGGQLLYDPERFAQSGVQLSFLHTQMAPEPLPDGPGYLSIIDSLMRYGPVDCRYLMDNYTVVNARRLPSAATETRK